MKQLVMLAIISNFNTGMKQFTVTHFLFFVKTTDVYCIVRKEIKNKLKIIFEKKSLLQRTKNF